MFIWEIKFGLVKRKITKIRNRKVQNIFYVRGRDSGRSRRDRGKSGREIGRG